MIFNQFTEWAKLTQVKKFLIDHIDPLGQGVFKDGDDIFFIPKTLPTEEGEFEIIRKKKGVHFGKVSNLTKPAPNRIEPSCPHFSECNGCHFLHTDYDSEINYKQKSYTKLIRNTFNINENPKVLLASNRLGYRNRIQLHYDLKKLKIGFLAKNGRDIISTPRCTVMNSLVAIEFERLIVREEWIKEARKTNKRVGHLEIYDSPNGILVSWNKPYAQGGFTQVNAQMNERMLDTFSKHHVHAENTLDLFGGKGNISNVFDYKKRICVDLYDDETNNEFFNCNLFEDSALDNFKIKNTDFSCDFMIVDPPRAGFKNLKQWVNEFSPEKILYVSCHPATMMRDLWPIAANYTINEYLMIDLFPSTFHYEGAVLLERIS